MLLRGLAEFLCLNRELVSKGKSRMTWKEYKRLFPDSVSESPREARTRPVLLPPTGIAQNPGTVCTASVGLLEAHPRGIEGVYSEDYLSQRASQDEYLEVTIPEEDLIEDNP